MSASITIAAVGDILMWGTQITSAKVPKTNRYSFSPMFKEVVPYLKKADLAIGNLETTFSGRESQYQKRNPRTTYPMFNCPDELATTLKKAGFHVLTTANNHCMDRGIKGLKRTISVLDRHGIAHTGTFSTYKASKKLLIKNVKGVKVGILAYTYGTNFIPVPKGKSWAVNLINEQKIISDMKRLKRKKADAIIVCLHFGREFHRFASEKQKNLVEKLFAHGADIILGAHPHVLQPIVYKKVKAKDNSRKKRVAIYSLGNFISDMMRNNMHTVSAAILYVTVHKNSRGKVVISNVKSVPTWVQRIKKNNNMRFRVLPVRKFIQRPDSSIRSKDLTVLKKVLRQTRSHLRPRSE